MFAVSSQAAITDGMAASNVLGQVDMTSSAVADSTFPPSVTTATGLSYPYGASFDRVNELLFVSDNGNGRVVVYDASDGITDGEAAIAVLGKPNLTDGTDPIANSPQINNLKNDSYGVEYDHVNQRLFVGDAYHRIVVYDLSDGVQDGEDAIAVLGQDNFNTTGVRGCDGNTTTFDECALNYPAGLAYHEATGHLYVADLNEGRVLVYDVNGTIPNNKTPFAALGVPDFTTRPGGVSQMLRPATATTLIDPQDLVIDEATGTLFVSDHFRVVAYDITSAPVTGQAAVGAIGVTSLTQTVNTGATPSASVFDQSGLDGGWPGQGLASMEIDRDAARLFVGDTQGSRILVFDLADVAVVGGAGTFGASATNVLGQPDFSTVTSNTACGGGSAGAVNACGFNEYTTTVSAANQLYVADYYSHRVLVFNLTPTTENGTPIENPDPEVTVTAEEQPDGSTDVTLEGETGIEEVVINLPPGTSEQAGETGIIIDSTSNNSGRRGGVVITADLPPGTTKEIVLNDDNNLARRRVCIHDASTATFTTQLAGCPGDRVRAPNAGASKTISISHEAGDPVHDVVLTVSADGLSLTISGLYHSMVIYSTGDDDGDGVPDEDDLCPDSVVFPDAASALADPVAIPRVKYLPHSMGDSETIHGCTPTQILECKPGRNRGEKRKGIHLGTQFRFENQIGWAANCVFPE